MGEAKVSNWYFDEEVKVYSGSKSIYFHALGKMLCIYGFVVFVLELTTLIGIGGTYFGCACLKHKSMMILVSLICVGNYWRATIIVGGK